MSVSVDKTSTLAINQASGRVDVMFGCYLMLTKKLKSLTQFVNFADKMFLKINANKLKFYKCTLGKQEILSHLKFICI
jgi:hypothetical protein